MAALAPVSASPLCRVTPSMAAPRVHAPFGGYEGRSTSAALPSPQQSQFLKGWAERLGLPLSAKQRGPATWRPRSRPLVSAVLKESQDLELGTRAPEFTLPEPLTGKLWSLSDFDGHPALLVMFICNHCPYVIHVQDELVCLAGDYSAKEGLGVVAISSNSVATHPQDGPELMAQKARDLSFPFPYLYDETQEVAKAYRAACTPDFYVFKKEGRRPFELAYHGQLDDSRPKSGKPVTGRDLRLALDCVLSGRPAPQPQRPSIGCNVKWTPGKEPAYF